MKKTENMLPVIILVTLAFLTYLGCGPKTDKGTEKANEGSRNYEAPSNLVELKETLPPQDISLDAETASAPVEMELEDFDKPKSADLEACLEIGLDRNVRTIVSKTDKFAFSPQKMFDSNPLTCMAVSSDVLKSRMDLFISLASDSRFYIQKFSTAPSITGFSIESGYFDKEYYYKNARPGKIRMVIKSQDNGQPEKVAVDETFALNDVMETQNFVFSRQIDKRTIRQIDIYVTDTYAGEEWQDVCISGLRFLSGNYRVPVRLNPSSQIDIEWYCENKLPVIGRWRIEFGRGYSHSGIVHIIYDSGNRIKRLDIYNNYSGEYVESPVEITCSYIYSKNKIIVYDETNGRQVCEYGFEDGRLVYEKRSKFVPEISREGNYDKIIQEYRYSNGKESSDDIREFIIRNDQYYYEILRMDNEIIGMNKAYNSEHDIYDSDGVLIRSRRETDWILPSVQFLRPEL